MASSQNSRVKCSLSRSQSIARIGSRRPNQGCPCPAGLDLAADQIQRSPRRRLDPDEGGRTVRGVIQGDSRPRDFIPRLVDLCMAAGCRSTGLSRLTIAAVMPAPGQCKFGGRFEGENGSRRRGNGRPSLLLMGGSTVKCTGHKRGCHAGEIEKHGRTRAALAAPTAADARDVMIEGESGVLAVSPPWDLGASGGESPPTRVTPSLAASTWKPCVMLHASARPSSRRRRSLASGSPRRRAPLRA